MPQEPLDGAKSEPLPVIAQANEVNAEVLEKFLDYVYTGEVEVKYT